MASSDNIAVTVATLSEPASCQFRFTPEAFVLQVRQMPIIVDWMGRKKHTIWRVCHNIIGISDELPIQSVSEVLI